MKPVKFRHNQDQMEELLTRHLIFSGEEWFTSLDFDKWEDVEITVHGNQEKPAEEFIKLSGQFAPEFPKHIQRSLDYLGEFFPHQDRNGYYLTGITFGSCLTVEERRFKGVSFMFTYGEYPDAFQFKVKLKEDGWPMGFEGGPL